jgi:hypothetical protein
MGWPPATMPYNQDRASLARHKCEIAALESFNQHCSTEMRRESPLRKESAKEKAGYLPCRLVIHLTQHVGVGVERDADGGMAEAGRDDLRRDAG